MKIKNINLSFFLLTGLIFLSFSFYVGAENSSKNNANIFLDGDQDGLSDEEEKIYGTDPSRADTDGDGYSDGAEVKSGYDPTKPAPGDKIVFSEVAKETEKSVGTVLGEESEDNLTKKLAEKITKMNAESISSEKGVGLENVETLVDESLSENDTSFSEEALPEFDRSGIKVKKQDYAKYGEKKAQEKMKEDFLDYITAVFYIFSSNSPTPITSLSDMPTLFTNMTKTVTSAISKRDPKELKALSESQEKIQEQLKDVEVPEDSVETHVKALRFALYAKKIPDMLKTKNDDPMGEIANLSNIQGYISSLSSFVMDFQGQFSKYGLTYDADVKERLNNLGIETPEEIDSIFNEVQTSVTTDTTTETKTDSTTETSN